MRSRLPAIALFVLGMAVACGPMLLSGFSRMEVDPADTRHLNYVLEHDFRWLTGRAELWHPQFFFPERHVATYTELMLGVVPFYAPWRVLGAEPDTAFQLWMMTVLALTFLAAWKVFRLEFEPWPAAAGAFVVGFGSARMAHLNHAHLLPLFWALLALYALVKLERGAPPGWIAVFSAALALQFWSCITTGWFFCFWLGIALLLRRKLDRRVALGAVLTVPLLLPLALAYRGVEPRSFDEAASMVPQLQSWFYQGPHSVLYGWAAGAWKLPMEGEHRIGLGLATTLVTIVVLRKKPWLAFTVLLIIAVSTLYRGRVSPWELVRAVVPGASGIRAVARIGLFLALPAGFAVATLATRARRLGHAVVALCLLEQLQRVPDTFDKAEQRGDVARLAAVVKGCPSFFYAPIGRAERYDEKTQLDAMWAGLQTGVPTINGYSSHFPERWDLFEHSVDEPKVRAALARWISTNRLGNVCLVTDSSQPPQILSE